MAQDNVDVVQSAWDAFARGDIEAVLDTIAPAAETRVPETLPWGGTSAGPDGFGDFIARLIVTVKVKGRTKRGTTIENRAVWIYQLRDGRIADAETFGDTAQVLQALG